MDPIFLACVGAFLVVVLLTLLPLWRRRQGADCARELIRRRLTVAALATVLLIVLRALVLLVETEASMDYFEGATVALMWAGIAWMVRRREALGPVLLRMPWRAGRWILLGGGVMYFAMAAAQVSRFGWTIMAPLSLTVGTMFFVLGSRPLEFREGGIASGEEVWRWSQLTHLAWVGEDHSLLEIRVRTRWLPCRPGFVRVPADRRQRVVEILDEHAASSRAPAPA